MSEKTFEIKSQQFAQKKQAEAQAAEAKKLSGVRQEIGHLEGQKGKIKTSYENLQELSGLRRNEISDYFLAKKAIENFLREHKEDLAAEGVQSRKDVVSEYPQEEKVKTYKKARQEIGKTRRKINKEWGNLRKQGMENIRGGELETEFKGKASQFDEKISELKLQTPEGQEEKNQQFKSRIKEGFKELDRHYPLFQGKIDEIDLNRYTPFKEIFKEAKNFGQEGEKIAKEAIIEVFQEKNEKMAGLIKTKKSLDSIQENGEKVHGLDRKIKSFENEINETLPSAFDQEIEKDKELQKYCAENHLNGEKIVKDLLIQGYENSETWLATLKGAYQNGVDVIRSDFKRTDYGFPDASTIEADLNQLSVLMNDFKDNLRENIKKDYHHGIYQILNKKINEYNYAYPSREILELIGKNGLYSTTKGVEERIKDVEQKLSAKIDLEWLKEEKDFFKNEKEPWKIENKLLKIKERKEIAQKFLHDLSDIENGLRQRFDEKIRYGTVESWRGEKEDLFYSPQGATNSKELEKKIGEIRKSQGEIFKERRSLEEKGSNIFKKKAWQKEINELGQKEKNLSQNLEETTEKYKEQEKKNSQLQALNKILQDLNLGSELIKQELTIEQATNLLKEKLRFIQSQEVLSPEEENINRGWQAFDEKIKKAERKYSRVSEEAPDF